MDTIKTIKEVFKKIGVSTPAAVPFVGPVYAQLLSQFSSEKHKRHLTELLTALTELKKEFERPSKTSSKQLQSMGFTTKETIDEEIRLLEAIKTLRPVFSSPSDEFQFLIERNFLYKFDCSDSPDYLRLLSTDFNDLFFSFFNSSDCTCIIGRRGVGKTFNCLLISNKLEKEGHKVHYSSVKKAELSEKMLSELADVVTKDFVFIIDDCQANTEKAETILKILINSKKNTERPKLILLIRNDGLSIDDIRDLIGEEIPILEFKKRFVDLRFLTELFFRKIKITKKLDDFLSSLEKSDLSRTLFEYKNMEFWNRFFKQVEHSGEIKITEEEFYKSAYKYFADKESHLIRCKDILVRFLPYFKNDLSIMRRYIGNSIQSYSDQYQTLIDRRVINVEPQDWGDSSEIFIAPKLHSTEAEILQLVLQKYEGSVIDEKGMLIDYMSSYPANLYELITPFYFYGSETLEELCKDPLFVSLVRKYFRERELGKRLDRVVKAFSKIEPQSKETLIDDEVIDSLAEKLNKRERYIVSKLYLFLAIYKLSPLRAYQLFKKFNSKILIDDFNNDPRGIYSFVKFMEVFKNIYYYADQDVKADIINKIKRILDGCFEQFVKKFEESAYFSQFHWFLKRLDGMKLSDYFLGKIPAVTIVDWIKCKDTRINELRFVFKTARFISAEINGVTVNLYHGYFKNAINYEDAKRIFSNRRSKLYDITITSAFSHEILANYLYQYSSEESFAQKVLAENNLYTINESISLVETNAKLSNEQKKFVVGKIIGNTPFSERLFKETVKAARKIGKEIDINLEKERFLSYREKYACDFA